MASRDGSIEAPYTISSIPGPLDREHGRIQASPVLEFKGSRKRKRHEVAVGIDGEGVNIYNVQSHSLITSYALPPQSYLCCPPCSIHSRSSTSSIPKRHTFVTIKDGRESSKRRLLSFTETTRNKSNRDQELSGPEKRECKLHGGELLSLEIIPSMSDELDSVLVHYSNGSVEFISQDLSKSHIHDRPSFKDKEIYIVEQATLVDVESAKKGILKSREDVVALLDQGPTSVSNGILLCRVVRSNHSRHFELYATRNPITNTLQTSRSPLQLLTSYELPSRALFSVSTANYQLHAEAGMLYQLLDDTLKIFDLTSTSPRAALELGDKSNPIHSFIPVSLHSVMILSNNTASLIETSFGSVQGSVSLKAVSSGSQGRKRKRDGLENPTPLRTIAAFADPGLVTALVGNELVAFQVQFTSREGRNIRPPGTLLSSVIGNGRAQKVLDQDMDGMKARNWDDWKAQVDALVADDDLEGLERLVANDSRLGRQRKQKRSRKSLQNGDAEVYEELWPLPEAFDPRDVDRRKALYIVSQVFSHDESEHDILQLRLESTKLLEWLTLTGFLTASEVQKAYQASETEISGQPLEPGAIMTAIRRIDGNFQVMRDLLSLPVHWEAAEIIQALRQVIQSFDTPPNQDQMLALPAPPTISGETELTNGDVDLDLEHESEAVEKELDLAISTLSTGLEVRSDTVQVITKRLHAFPPSTVTTTMREMMSHSEIVFFIHILRIELADGGWTSQYVDLGDSEIQDGLVNTIGSEEERGRPSDQAIKAIGDLLNCAVDAIGTSGWLVGQSGSADGADGLIDALRAEVSAGLEGCYEASTLQTLLTELEKCFVVSETAFARPRPPAITEGGSRDLDKSFLPLVSKVGSQPVSGKNQKADQKKTKMAIGREKSKRVGQYSFERIRV